LLDGLRNAGTVYCARQLTEQGSTFGRERYVGCSGRVIVLTTFGASALLKELQKEFGFALDGGVAIEREALRKG